MKSDILNELSKTDKRENDFINPKKFALWLIIVASIMLFAAFTSAYIVRRGEGNWELFNLPNLFAYNTILIIISSIFMQWAFIAARKDEISKVKIALAITIILGIVFCYLQYQAWKDLVSNSVYLVGNPSGSFVYVISGVHMLHVIGGLLYVAAMLIQTFRFKVHKKNILHLGMCTTYWHFVGILWAYLYLFFKMYR